MIVLRGAYHGNTQGLIEVSPYKFEGRGGSGPPEHGRTRVVPMPDDYRGLYRRDDPRRAAKFAAHVAAACKEIEAAKLDCTLMVDCSHANSSKQHERQIEVARDVAAQMKAGSRCIFGVMVESHLNAGAQKFSAGKDDPAKLEYGKSITDACIGWDDSLTVLDVLSEAVTARRRATGSAKH